LGGYANVSTDVISTSNALLWTQIESCVGVICACLPTLKGPIGKLLPNLFTIRGRSTRDAYEIDTVGNNGSSVTWKDDTQSTRPINSKDHDEVWLQESSVGITKTVDIQVISKDEGIRVKATAGSEIFRGEQES